MIQLLGLHQPSCNLCCSAPVFSQAPPPPSSTGTKGWVQSTVLCHSLWWLFYCSVHCLTQQYGLAQPQQGCGQCFSAGCLCVKLPPGFSLSAMNKAPFGSGVGPVTPLGYKKGLYMLSSSFSKSYASLFTT